MSDKPQAGSVLIVTRHYPPRVSGGARRPFLLAQGLRARGCRVWVAAPQAPAEEPDTIIVPHYGDQRIDAAAGTAAPGRRARSWRDAVRPWLMWPDPDIRWCLTLVRAVRRSDVRADWVLTTSPPESIHVTGALLKRHLGARWLAELRDGWVHQPLRGELQRSRVRRAGETMLARLILRKADVLVGVSPSILAEIAAYARPGTQIAEIGHFAQPPPPSPSPFEANGDFNIVQTGSFSLSHPGRRLEPVLDAFESALRARPDLRLHLVGRLTPEEAAAAATSSAAGRITVHGVLPLQEVGRFQRWADALLLCQAPETDALPGKLAEYRAAGAPILAIGEGPWRPRLGPDVIHGFASLPERADRSSAPLAADAAADEAIASYERLFRGLDSSAYDPLGPATAAGGGEQRSPG